VSGRYPSFSITVETANLGRADEDAVRELGRFYPWLRVHADLEAEWIAVAERRTNALLVPLALPIAAFAGYLAGRLRARAAPTHRDRVEPLAR
jgi:hypothetical protein